MFNAGIDKNPLIKIGWLRCILNKHNPREPLWTNHAMTSVIISSALRSTLKPTCNRPMKSTAVIDSVQAQSAVSSISQWDLDKCHKDSGGDCRLGQHLGQRKPPVFHKPAWVTLVSVSFVRSTAHISSYAYTKEHTFEPTWLGLLLLVLGLTMPHGRQLMVRPCHTLSVHPQSLCTQLQSTLLKPTEMSTSDWSFTL